MNGPNEDGNYTRVTYRVMVHLEQIYERALPQGGWVEEDREQVEEWLLSHVVDYKTAHERGLLSQQFAESLEWAKEVEG